MAGLQDLSLPSTWFCTPILCTLSVNIAFCFPCMDCYTNILYIQPACVQSFSSSGSFEFPSLRSYIYICIVHHNFYMGSYINNTPFFLRSGVGVFTKTREFLHKAALMFRCLHLEISAWISSKRPLMYGSSIIIVWSCFQCPQWWYCLAMG